MIFCLKTNIKIYIFSYRRWKGGLIEPHPTEKALIVNYKLEAAVFSEPENPMLEEKKDCQRVIRLKSLNSKTDCAALAREVVEKCDLIHVSQLSEIEQIIYYLKNRKEAGRHIALHVLFNDKKFHFYYCENI